MTGSQEKEYSLIQAIENKHNSDSPGGKKCASNGLRKQVYMRFSRRMAEPGIETDIRMAGQARPDTGLG